MSPHSPRHLVLTEASSHAPSKARKQFNSLVGKLKTLRLRVSAWHAAHAATAQRVEGELMPLAEQHAERLKQRLVLLDRLHGEARLTQRERDKLSRYLVHAAIDLLEDDDDPALKEIYNRHTGGDFDAEDKEEESLFRDMLGEMFGIEAGDDVDLRDMDNFIDALSGKLGEDGVEPDERADERNRRKRPATLAREQREAQEAARLKQSMRDIFRKLASELHPDREADPTERERKTGLMQRVNAAYAANDLLGLLELQLEVEQLDQDKLDAMDDKRIVQFNKILSNQVRELQREQRFFEEQAVMVAPVLAYRKVSPEMLPKALDRDLAELRADLALLERELAALDDVKQLKAWIKQCRVPQRRPAEWGDPSF